MKISEYHHQYVDFLDITPGNTARSGDAAEDQICVGELEMENRILPERCLMVGTLCPAQYEDDSLQGNGGTACGSAEHGAPSTLVHLRHHERGRFARASYKAKLMRLHAKKVQWVRLEQNDGDLFRDEQLSLFYLVRQKKRRAQRRVTVLKTDRDVEMSNDSEICDAFADHYERHFDRLHSDPDRVARVVGEIREKASGPDLSCLDQPITENELFTAVRKGALNKAPGIDGVGQAFYKIFWDTIKMDLLDLMNFMFQHGARARQNHGIIIHLPKIGDGEDSEDYRSTTLLTTEYKLLTRITAARMRPLLHDALNRTQFCGA
jgi:hypothetical protein